MTHVFFDPNSVDWTSFLSSQQEGRGARQYFVGSKYQRGFGFLGNVVNFLTPIAKNIATSAGQEGIAAGQRVLSDIAQGKELKDALQTHSKQGFENLSKKLQQCGKGRKRKVRDQLSIL